MAAYGDVLDAAIGHLVNIYIYGCEYQMCSAARSARGPALTDDVSTLDVSTQANGQNPEGLFINGAQSWT